MNNTYERLVKLLLSDPDYVAEDGNVLKATVYSDAITMKQSLLELLLSDDEIKRLFFKEVNDTLIFDKQEFAWLINSKEFLPDSYTAYTNKIGLTSNAEFISLSDKVVLDFPYKDALLAGGQDKEDQKREEIMYHYVLAREQITNLLAPKVFTNAKRYKKNGVEENITLNDEDNLIIKGNNLVALSSLLGRYEGKVKLIYIDPPYYFRKKIAEDSFKYNSNFRMSTWLTFMKNRLVLAEKLLMPGGSIWVHIGEDGMHYLKVLMDDIFGKDHFVATLPRKTRDGKSDVPFNLSQDFDWILVYTNVEEKKTVVGRSVERKYYTTEDFPKRPWRTADATSQRTIIERPNSDFTMINPKTGKEYPVNPKRSWAVTKDTFVEYYDAGGIGFPDDYEFMSGNRPFRRVFKDEDDRNTKPTAVYSDFLIRDLIKNLLLKSKNKDGNDEIDTLFSRDDFNYAKPENLIKSILDVATDENDLILDFFLGSGTTAAVAHKMGRRYIGIEQMDYVKSVTVPRLQKVMKGEQGGISKEVKWQGGGSYVSCTLKEDSAGLIHQIQNSTEDTIDDVKASIYAEERIVPYLSAKELEITESAFNVLSIEEKKKALVALVDKNKLYVNYSSIEDEEYQVSDSDKAFTKSFYEGGKTNAK